MTDRSPISVRPDVAIERNLEQLTHMMDTLFRIPVLGWRFGLNAIIDLIPGIGDTATSLVALYLLGSAVRYRIPKITMVRMGINVAIYFVVGLLPLVGTLFGAWWKPNNRNIKLLRRYATVSAEQAQQARASDKLFVSVIILLLLALLFGSVVVGYLALQKITEQMWV